MTFRDTPTISTTIAPVSHPALHQPWQKPEQDETYRLPFLKRSLVPSCARATKLRNHNIDWLIWLTPRARRIQNQHWKYSCIILNLKAIIEGSLITLQSLKKTAEKHLKQTEDNAAMIHKLARPGHWHWPRCCYMGKQQLSKKTLQWKQELWENTAMWNVVEPFSCSFFTSTCTL